MIPNINYRDLKESYLFYNIAQKTKAYLAEHPGSHLYRMGIGDVSLPLCDAVIKALHEAVDDQATNKICSLSVGDFFNFSNKSYNL